MSPKPKLVSTLVVANQDYLPILTGLLARAKRQIDALEYSFPLGMVGRAYPNGNAPFEIANQLARVKAKLKKSIRIRLLLEGKRDTAERNRVTGEYLKKHGIQVVYGSTHAKGFCVDERYVLFGSTNLTHQSISKNNEVNLLLDSPAIASEFIRYFEHLWSGGKHGGISMAKPLLADGAFKDELIEVISQAKKEIQFSIYFFDHPEIEAALIEAHERGVKIKGLIHHHESFALSYVRRTRRTVERLKKAGLKALYFGPPHLFTHSKFLIADQKEVMLGTGNWLVEDVTIHPQLYIHLSHPDVAKELKRVLAKHIRAAS